jgi:hypothetical protein
VPGKEWGHIYQFKPNAQVTRVCTVTSVARAEAQCLATYVLPGGQITGQALIVLGDPAPYAVWSPE